MEGENSECEEEELFVSSPLFTAASNRDVTEVARLLAISNSTINERDHSEFTPIQIAIENNDIKTVTILLSHGADSSLRFPRFPDYFEAESTSVSQAAELGYFDILKLLIDNGGLVTSTSLYTATRAGQLGCFKELFTWMVKNDRREFDDGIARLTAVTRAFNYAAAGWRDDFVEFILASGEADKNAVDCALLMATLPAHFHDDYPLRSGVRKGPPEAARKKHNSAVKLLLDAGADVDAAGNRSEWGIDQRKPLHEIAGEGNRTREVFDMLLDRNADVNSLNKGIAYEDGRRTPLFEAVLADDVYFVQRLLEKGADMNRIDKYGNTILHASTFNWSPARSAIVSLLLRLGLSSSAINAQGETPLHLAAKQANIEAVQLLLSSNPDLVSCRTVAGWTALHFVPDTLQNSRTVPVADLLLSHGADINAVTSEGWTVLYRAVRGYHRDTTAFVSFLLKRGADITMTDYDPISASLRAEGVVKQSGDSLLHLALDRQYHAAGSLNIIRLLLDNGADIESKDIQGRTPLLRAVGHWEATSELAETFRPEYLMELVNRGANVNAKDNAGLGLEECVKNKGYKVCMKDGKVTGFKKIPIPPKVEMQLGFGRGAGRGRRRRMVGPVEGMAGLEGQVLEPRGHGQDL